VAVRGRWSMTERHPLSVRDPAHPYDRTLDAALTAPHPRRRARTSSPPPRAPGRAGPPRPADAPRSMSPIELVLFGVACYHFGLVSGAVVIPWLVDRGLFPVRRHVR
jgi:hypothetical protein